ncbi:hypothetical protein Ancab_008150 [Ancistrocladus abbreviatus]
MPHFHDTANDPLAEMEETSPASMSESLKVPKLRSEAVAQVSKSLAEAYDLVYNAIMNPENHYPDPKSLARHPPDQIRTILGI